jgi:hypothetical protein
VQEPGRAEAAAGARRWLHILNGDSLVAPLRQAGVPGTFSVWADVLHEGPVPSGLTRDAQLEVRARFLAGDGASYQDALDTLRRWATGLDSFAGFDEVILWFEHDLFDQLNLVHHLNYYGSRPLGEPRLSLICIGEYPGVERFVGLGQLEPKQLAGLLALRAPVTADQLTLGVAAWQAFTAPQPDGLERLLGQNTSSLPYLAPALYRFLEEYPSTANGLGRTEQQILTLLAERPRSAAELFRGAMALEESPFMGDLVFRSRLATLGGAADPALEWDARWHQPDGGWQSELSLTDTGRDLLASRQDWVRLNGIDRWYGGVHLEGHEVGWRWDSHARRLRPTA